MRFCTTCGSPVSGILRFCTRCGAATSSTAGAGVASSIAGAGVASVAATGTVDPDPAEAGLVKGSSLPVNPARAQVADAGAGGVPADPGVPAEAAAPGPAPQDSPAPPAEAQPTGEPGDAGPLRMVRIGAEPTDEASPEDPWLPGSRRPDRRALIIGVVLIAGLLSVASTAWLIRVDPPQASSPHGAHRSRPSKLGSDDAQRSQALPGQPTPILIQRSQPAPSQLQPRQPAPTQTGNGPAGPGQAGPGQPRHDQSDSGHPRPSRSGTGPSRPGQPGAIPTGTHGTGSGQPGSGTSGSGSSGSGSSGTGHAGTGRGTAPAAPHPRPPAPGSRDGRTPRHPRPGVVSITPGLAGRADARRVGGLLARYFAAVNHRRYQAYASLFAQRRQLTPRDFAWGYRTSHDSNAVLVGVAALKGGLRATVTFTSQQDPAQSPDHSSCIDWRIILFLHRTGANYLIGMPPPGYRAGLQACGFAPRQSSPGHSRHRTATGSSSTHRSSTHRSSTHRSSRRSLPRHFAARHSSSGHSASGHSASDRGPGHRKDH
jgi:hypothetical protein